MQYNELDAWHIRKVAKLDAPVCTNLSTPGPEPKEGGSAKRNARNCHKFRVLFASLVVLVVIVITLVFAGDRSDFVPVPLVTQAGTALPHPTRVAPREKALGRVHSLQELRDFCHAKAPELETASWVTAPGRNASAGHPYTQVMYLFEPAPVCIDEHGIVMVDEDFFKSGKSNLLWMDQYAVMPLSDERFKLQGEQGYAVAVPAMGILTNGLWIATHIWHMVHDTLEGVMAFFQRYNNGEMWSMPTQTVLLEMPGVNWVDRYGDTLKKMELSAQVLNIFSSPRRGGPFFPTSLIYQVHKKKLQEYPEVKREKVAERLKQPLLRCFCQAMSVNPKPTWDFVTPETYYAIQDLVPAQFGEDAYMGNLTLTEIVERRLSAHPWSGRFWRGDAFTAAGVYRPRALVLHRQSRLIGDVDRYIKHLHKLEFRVEEIFPEKLTIAQQFHLGRYTDLLVGMHGLGIAHGFWMDRFPIGCRTIVEFRPWVHQALPIQLHRIMGRYMKFNYYYPVPTEVIFGNSVKDKTEERRRLLLPQHIGRAWSFPGFTDQEAYYNDTEIYTMLDTIRQHLDKCLPQEVTALKQSPVTQQPLRLFVHGNSD